MRMSKVVLAALAACALPAGSACATLVSFSADTLSTWSPEGAVMFEHFTSLGAADVTITAEAHSDFTVSVLATNDTGFVWTGYYLGLDPDGPATFVDGSAGSTRFNTIEYADPWTLRFHAPQEVAPGGVVTMQFDVAIPDPGPYTFALTQEPIPEPATAALLAVGAAALLTSKRRR